MGKAARQKAIKEEPKVINKISINLLDNGGVNVSGPIQNPLVVIDLLGKALNALSQFYAENEKKNHIVKPPSNLVLPR